MIHKTGTFKGNGGTILFHQSWFPHDIVRAVIVIIHGGGDHSGRFGHVVGALVPAGMGICMFDLRGHGRSPGKRGHINSWSEYRDDLSAFLALVKNTYTTCPLFLFGHSMGAVVALDYCIREQPDIAGLICTSPAIGKLGIPPVMFKLAWLLDKITPSLVLPNGLVVPHLSRDRAFIKRTKADTLYHTLSTPRFGMEMKKAVNFVQSHASELRLPLYLIHGTDDRIASIEGSRTFVRNAGSKAVTYREYQDGYHELFNDLDKDTVLDDMISWLKENTPATRPPRE